MIAEPAAAPVLAVVGATATGKSELGVALGSALSGEVVNADALQLYRGMDLGTAKLTPAERRGVPHHLLDVLEVTDEASVAAYQRQALAVLDTLAGRGARGIVVGGSGLYLRAALDVLTIPPTDPSLRAALEEELAQVGAAVLHRRLAGLDPQAADRILATNGRRVVRALEVIALTGRRFTASLPEGRYLRPTLQLGLVLPREVLDDRLTARVEAMWAAGLVEEVRGLESRGLRAGRTASRALGYAQVLRLLAGDCTDQEARQDTVRATRRFARRQESWFRRDPRIHWLPADAPDLVDRALTLIDRAGGAGAPAAGTVGHTD